jgi:hypothetical protein
VAPAAPQQRRHDDPPRASRLRARDLLRDFERDGLDVYNSPQTDLGAALAILNHLEDSPAIRRLQDNVRVVAAQIEEKYMTEESEHYMDHLRIQVVYDLIGSRIQGCIPAYDLVGSRTRRYTSRVRPHWVQNPAHKINILQGLSYSERSRRPTLPKQGMSRDFS